MHADPCPAEVAVIDAPINVRLYNNMLIPALLFYGVIVMVTPMMDSNSATIYES